jgi:parallel beta-helix repeat protein
MRACWSVIAIVVLWFNVTPATIINVPADYSTIQMAIDSSSNGDTVLVQPNTYYENIDFYGHNVVLGSLFLITGDTSYISTTIVDGSSSAPVVMITSGADSTAMLVGFTIQNSFFSAVYIGDSSPTIKYNTITGNSCSGIYCSGASPTISYNTISGNTTSASGGGIYCSSNSSPTISANTISGNSAGDYGGGIEINYSNPTINYNTIIGNSADEGGGIDCDNSSPTIINNTISGNSASYGGGINCLYSNPTITNTIFWGDSASTGPEIYLINPSSPIITYCDIQDTLWTGIGNISCDPMFCEPNSGNFYLADSSCCVGAGQGGVDIGALGVGCSLQQIPTLSEWGMLILALLLLAAGTVAVVRRRKTSVVTEKYNRRNLIENPWKKF